ncbi:MAG: Holliday junction branch migration protein RuvA [Candidatus Symbiobacter sp.]|nr:Holliday junction branch migration protein RuvA [Candidatus Symbiobacter sp.]
MIAKLAGIIEEIGTDQVILMVGGVGYAVQLSERSKAECRTNDAKTFHIDMRMGEDHITLYGFPSAAEKKWFQLLQSVQGVGGRVAMAILGSLAPSELQQAILAGDAKTLTRANGVGAKLASRLILELKDKVFTVALPDNDRPPPAAADAAPAASPAAAAHPDQAPRATTPNVKTNSDEKTRQDALSALENLGFARAEAYAALSQVWPSLTPPVTNSALIRAALKELNR